MRNAVLPGGLPLPPHLRVQAGHHVAPQLSARRVLGAIVAIRAATTADLQTQLRSTNQGGERSDGKIEIRDSLIFNACCGGLGNAVRDGERQQLRPTTGGRDASGAKAERALCRVHLLRCCFRRVG